MPKQILVVDDSVTIRETLSRLLTDAGYQVQTANDGQAALSAIEGIAVDLLISDINMPRMDGISLVSAVRKLPGKRFLPIIMLTSESLEHKERAKQAGASGWISKPFSNEKVQSIVKMVLR